MTVLYTHHDFTRVGMCKSIVESAGIACFIENENSHNVFTGIPSPIFYPRLTIIDDSEFERAADLIRDFIRAPAGTMVEWKCAGCGEMVPGEFGSCWNCGMESPGSAGL